jgi:tetratricopeptide (TPR) repeat protein
MRATDVAQCTLPDAPAELQRELDRGGAVVWEQPVELPTYAPGEPSRYPMFLDRRVYQGSSGRVYPLPFIDRIASEAAPASWTAVHLENRWVRLMVLPELGGRIHVGYDKSAGYDFFYRNNVIKPALVGLAGPWLSGGVEFNWPQHHRPATHLPVEWTIEHGDDGSVTVWCSDHEPFARMKGMHGIRLHPDRAVVELVVRLHNRTSERQTFLWWANVAARVHDDYQSFFPTDVRFVADHARRALTAFPTADRPYYGVDYPARAADRPGTDRIDFYRNIPVPTSYMIVDSDGEFFGGYDHAADAGFVHWAERRISPGKKQWTWGDAPFGHAWDAHLTDGDGPYVELMAGVYTDNQPDFSWLMPGETKFFSQFWYPISRIGVPVAATLDAVLHVSRDGDAGSLRIGVGATRELPEAAVRIVDGGREIASWVVDLDPARPFVVTAADVPGSARVLVEDRAGNLLVASPEPVDERPEPWTATEPPAPHDVGSVEELHLIGVHLRQYRHPTRSPLQYWQEAIARDPGHVGAHLALADTTYRAGDYDAAAEHACAALARLTARNVNPADTEAFYLLGLIESRRGRLESAASAFGRAMWDRKWEQPALVELARLEARAGDVDRALADLEVAARLDADDLRVAALRVVLLRRVGRVDEADALLADARRLDPLDVALREIAGEHVRPSDAHVLLDVASDLRAAGEVDVALALLARAATEAPTAAGNVRPIAHYLRAQLLDELGRTEEGRAERASASTDRRWAFPAGLDAHDALRAAIAAEPGDPTPRALLGMLLFDAGRKPEAAEQSRRAIELGDEDAVTARNLGLAAYNVLGDDELAWTSYERARRLDPHDARLLYELDQLAARLEHDPRERLARLEADRELVLCRDDLTIEYAELLVDTGRAHEAVGIIESRAFQPWEGGEGRVLGAWDRARAAAGLPGIDPPANLGEARPVVPPPAATLADGSTDYFATSLPDLLLFARE